MKIKLEVCPKCGSKINEVSSSNNKHFYKCSNAECHFALPEEYTAEHIFLQGYILNSKCIKCGNPLEVSCGSEDLYPRCYHCNPRISEDTDKQILWSNACSFEARKEIENLRKLVNDNYFLPDNYQIIKDNCSNGMQEDIEITSKNATQENIEPISQVLKKCTTQEQKVLEILKSNENKGWSSGEIAKILNISVPQARSIFSSLKNSKKIQMVGFKKVTNKPLLVLYQTVDSPLQKMKVKTKQDGYDTLTGFYQRFKEELPPLRIVKCLVKKQGLEMQPILYEKGLLEGYNIEDLKRICLQKISKKKPTPSIKENFESIKERIINYLKKHPDRGIGCDELQSRLKIHKPSLQNALRTLKLKKLIKIVGYKENSDSIQLTYQVCESPIPEETEIYENCKDIVTISSFYKQYGNQISVNISKAPLILAQKNIKRKFVLVKGRVFTGYNIKDLKQILLPSAEKSAENSSEDNSTFKNIFSSFFKNKKEITEVINF